MKGFHKMIRTALMVGFLTGVLISPVAAQTRSEIRDPSGRMMGYVMTYPDRQEARDSGGRLLLTYRYSTDTTVDPSGKLISRGNTVSSKFGR